MRQRSISPCLTKLYYIAFDNTNVNGLQAYTMYMYTFVMIPSNIQKGDTNIFLVCIRFPSTT